MIRFAVWAVVSTKAQAATDKLSLEVQLDACRKVGAEHAWQETAGPYKVPGASRSFYVNLSDAEKDIPELANMLDAARSGLFDVLAIYSYDRLGDLADMIAQTLRFYGVQIFSVSQAVEPRDPSQFDPYESDAEDNMRDVSRITQRFRIADLRRKWKRHVPGRAERGLPPLSIPYGYKHVNNKTPPEKISERADLLIDMKDLYLLGTSVAEIERRANASGVKPRRADKWSRINIQRILLNPFYAGLTVFGRRTMTRDTRSKKKYHNNPESEWIIGKGQHEPLWDEGTWRAIVAEDGRRRERTVRSSFKYALSGLLSCAVCDHKLHRHAGSLAGKVTPTLSCDIVGGKGHIHLPYDLAVDLFSKTLGKALQNYTGTSRPENKQEESALRASLKDLLERRALIHEGFESKLYTKKEAAQKLDGLEAQSHKIETQLDDRKLATQSQADLQRLIEQVKGMLPSLRDYIANGDPSAANHTLSMLCRKITVTPDFEFKIYWRD